MDRLALLSDIHMRADYASEIEAELRAVVDRLSGGSFDRIFVLGDLIEDGESVAADEAHVERVHEILEDAPFPVTYMLGNHDVEALSHDTLSSILGQDRFRGVVELTELSVIYLDSTNGERSGSRGALGPDQREWLADAVAECDQPLVLSHHPLGDFDISDNEWFGQYPERAFLWDRKEAFARMEQSGPLRGTISGHIHQPGFTNFREMPHLSINAFSKEVPGKPLTGTYAEVEADDLLTVDVKARGDPLGSYSMP